MALFLETIHGDIIIDLRTKEPTLKSQIYNTTSLSDLTFLSKLHFFSSPPLHFQYSSDNFIFCGDPTYTGKGGQSAYHLLSQIDPSNQLSSKFTTFKPIDQLDFKTTFTSQQQSNTKRREWVKDLLTRSKEMIQNGRYSSSNITINQELEFKEQGKSQNEQQKQQQIPPVLLVSIPHSNGDVSSLFALYYTLPPQCYFGIANQYNSHYSKNDQIIDQTTLIQQETLLTDPLITFPEYLYDYVIGTVEVGSDIAYKLFTQTLPNPLVRFDPISNTNSLLSPSPQQRTLNNDSIQLSNTMNDSNSDLALSQNQPKNQFSIIPRGDVILQTAVISSPFPLITSSNRIKELVIPHHNKRLVKALKDAKQSAFDAIHDQKMNNDNQIDQNLGQNITETINFGSYLNKDGTTNEQTELLFVDTFSYNPLPQHYPNFLKNTIHTSSERENNNNNNNNLQNLQTFSPNFYSLDQKYTKLSQYGYQTQKIIPKEQNTSGGGGGAMNDDFYDDDDNASLEKINNTADNEVKIQIKMEPPKNILFISNLSHNTTKESLSTHLSTHCVVLSCELIKERIGGQNNQNQNNSNNNFKQQWKCYAFVNVGTESQCDNTVSSLDKSNLDNHTINIGYCHSTGTSGGGNGGSGDDIYMKVHVDQSLFFSKRPKKTTLAATVLAGGGAGSIMSTHGNINGLK